jgi:uncharacterized protein
MGRLLILLVIVVGVAWWLLGRNARVAAARRDADASPASKPEAAQDMIACAHCGVHLPRGDALLEGERVYCSDDHRRLGPRAP